MDQDRTFLREAIRLAWQARQKGNHPFGALLVDDRGNILLKAENSVVTESDCTGHAETNLMRVAARQFPAEFLSRCTLYTSTEPCPMCAGAIFWGNVRRVVYALSEVQLYRLVGARTDEVLWLPCREVFARGRKLIEVIGPLLEEEALVVHQDFWN